MVFKCLNGLSPTYVQNKFKYVGNNHGVQYKAIHSWPIITTPVQ